MYDKLRKEILDATTPNCDETGRFKDGARYWIRVFVTAPAAFHRIPPSRSKPVAEAILAWFDGAAGSDSYPVRNDAGSDRRKCLPHCFRYPHRTPGKNHAGEFKAPFGEMHCVPRGAAGPAAEHPEGPVPKEKAQKPRDRIDAIAHAARTGSDRRRYAKRPRMEGRYPPTFL